MGDISLISQNIPDLLPMQRSAGLHHSDVLSDLAIRLGWYEKSELSMSRLQLGCALEDMLAQRYAQHYPDRFIRIGELDIDGLPITPDLTDTWGYKFTSQSPIIPREIKLTWLSSRHDPSSDIFRRFWWQIKSQCIAMNTDYGMLDITHINGKYDYANPSVDSNVWGQKFTQKELSDHRTVILRHRDKMLREGWKGEDQK